MKKHQSQLLRCILATIFTIQFTSAVDFLFNGFNSSDVSLYGNATVESRILTLTRDSRFDIGRALYPSRIPTKQPNTSLVLPFSTSFIFAMGPYAGKPGGHGFVFVFVPHVGIQGSSSSQHLGLFNLTNNGDPNNHIFGVEFDVFRNMEFGDVSHNHVGIDVNSLTSVSDHEAGYWPPDDDANIRDERLFKNLVLNNGGTYQVWIDYADSIVNVTMAPAGMKRPKQPLLSVSLNLSEVLEDEMYVGFTASTGALIQSHKILAWSFSNTNFSLSEGLITEGLPSFGFPETPTIRFPETPTIRRTNENWKDNKVVVVVSVVAGLIAASICLFLTWWMCKRKGKVERSRSDSSEIFLRSDMDAVKIDEVPLYSFDMLANATNNFNVENKLGMGGFGPVYQGKLANGQEIAVKRLSAASGQGVEEFMNEVAVISKLQHRNLVKLLGCCVEREEKMLVYEYLQNRSLDVSLFDKSQDVLDWGKRFNIIEGIARGLLYLHRDSRLRIIHRDLKPSNILLDEYWNPKISDFGMARIFGGNQDQANTKRVMGTYGYMSPEYAMGGTFSEKSDVFSFGVLVLEIISGRRNTSFYNDELSLGLLGYAWKILNEDMNPMDLIDDRISTPAFLAGIKRCMWIGLLCVQEFPQSRPTMSTVLSMLSSEIVDLPMPEHPGFTHRWIHSNVNGPSFLSQTSSANQITITVMEGR